MLTHGLIKALEYADSPRSVRAAVWALEHATGFKTIDLIERKEYDPARDGFYRLAALYGTSSSSYSGKNITFDAALESAVVYACVKIISEDIARLPFFLYERTKAGMLEKAYGSRLFRLLHDAPNPEMSSGSFREALTARALMGMDGFARIERTAAGAPLALWPLISEVVTPVRTADRIRRYVVKDGNAQEKTFEQESIFHLKGFTLNGDTGDQVLNRARHTFGLTLSADEYAGRFFKNDASPGLIIERPATPGVTGMTPDAIKLFKKAWSEWHRGAARAHEPAILQDGMKASRMDPDHQKLQLIESRKHQIAEVCRLFRMQLHKVAELDRATNNNIEHQGIEYTGHTLGPWRSRWEEAVHLRLLTEEQKYHADGRPRMYAEFSIEAMQQGDFASQIAGFTSLINIGVFNIDEVRAWFNKNPVAGGDVHRAQMQMTDISKPMASEDSAKAAIAGETKQAERTEKLFAVGIDLVAKAITAAGNHPPPNVEIHQGATNVDVAPAAVTMNAITPRANGTPFDVLTGGRKTVKIKRNSRGLMESAEIETIYEDRAISE